MAKSVTQRLSQQAIFLCKSESFGRWLCKRRGETFLGKTQSNIDAMLRAELGIESRSELDQPGRAQLAFEALRGEYRRELAEA